MTENGRKNTRRLELGALSDHTVDLSYLLQTQDEVRKAPFTNGWEPLPNKALDELTARIGHLDSRYPISPFTTLIAQANLPFYNNVRLIRLVDPTWKNKGAVLYFLYCDDELFRLDGHSQNIHKVNRIARLELTDDTVLDYLRFFSFFNHGEHGAFLIAERMSQEFLPDFENAEFREILRDFLFPPYLNGITRDDQFDCGACVFYGNTIFMATFHIDPAGPIEMVDDDPVFHDLDVSVSVNLG